MYLSTVNSETPCKYERNATLYSAYRKPGEELFDYAVVVERVLSLLSHSRAIGLCSYVPGALEVKLFVILPEVYK